MAQDGVHSHLMLTITFLLFLVAELAAYTAMVHSSPGFLATGSEEIAESTKLWVHAHSPPHTHTPPTHPTATTHTRARACDLQLVML